MRVSSLSSMLLSALAHRRLRRHHPEWWWIQLGSHIDPELRFSCLTNPVIPFSLLPVLSHPPLSFIFPQPLGSHPRPRKSFLSPSPLYLVVTLPRFYTPIKTGVPTCRLACRPQDRHHHQLNPSTSYVPATLRFLFITVECLKRGPVDQEFRHWVVALTCSPSAGFLLSAFPPCLLLSCLFFCPRFFLLYSWILFSPRIPTTGRGRRERRPVHTAPLVRRA